MRRREFVTRTAISSLALLGSPIFDTFQFLGFTGKPVEKENIDALILKNFSDLHFWLNDKGWFVYINQILNIELEFTTEYSIEKLINRIENIEKVRTAIGIEDFGGYQMICPGSPSMSLLYHILCSPRVENRVLKQYPSIEQIDQLENFIYSLEPRKSIENKIINKENIFYAVLAYEYRPAFKVPPLGSWKRGDEWASLVYSRTGIARIGNRPLNYDNRKRSFLNVPEDLSDSKNIAITPARYGLFLVEVVKSDHPELEIMNIQTKEWTRFNRKRADRHFIRPITKIFNTTNEKIVFGEYHKIEKLKKLAEYSYKGRSISFNSKTYNYDLPPFTMVSAQDQDSNKLHLNNTNEDFITLYPLESSILVSSVPNPLIRPVSINNKGVSFKVPKIMKRLNTHSNRRYSSLKLPNDRGHEVINVLVSDVFGRRRRGSTSFRSLKIAPLFVNIKFKVKKDLELKNPAELLDYHLNNQKEIGEFEEIIHKGGYYAQVFEDSICDGCISAKFLNNNSLNTYKILPAFSLITAPDFFPLVDSNDLRSYYYSLKNVNIDQDFFEGGTINLSGIRQRGNPSIIDPFTFEKAFGTNWKDDKSFDTLTAVVSNKHKEKRSAEELRPSSFKFSFKKDYEATSFLPDTGTGVFYPGWDATYSGEDIEEINPFLATFGLGSPFPEDMKLCASANGMWPVTSPDAGRTFQGSLEPIMGRRPNTSIPLMDDEIGKNKNSAYVLFYKEKETLGWDGEQGPFLHYLSSNLCVNYTDVNKADYLRNLLDPMVGFNMSLTRNLNVTELTKRMDCLRKCIREIDGKKLWNTQLWLINAIKIDEWKNDQEINCLPSNFPPFINKDFQKRQSDNLMGEGYFFSFALIKNTIEIPQEEYFMKKRVISNCSKIWLCQVTKNALAYCLFEGPTFAKSEWKKV